MNIAIEIEVDSTKLTMCIDTGADSSIIYDKDYKMMRSLIAKKIQFKHLKNMQISNLNGVQMTGFYELPIKINDCEFKLKTAVTNDIDEIDESFGLNGILGIDFIEANNGIIDVVKGIITLNGNEYKIMKKKTLFSLLSLRLRHKQ